MSASQRRSILIVFVLVSAALIALQPAQSQAHKTDTALPQVVVKQATPIPPPLPAARVDIQKVQVLPGQPDAALDAPPKAAEAVVVDAHNPNWVTRYGTQLGRMLLPPRLPDQSLMSDGPVPPFAGFWLTTTIEAGTQGIKAVAYTPDGRLFAATGLGLRVYGPDIFGIYQWTSIPATLGGLLSNNVTALAIFNNQLWIGTGSSGVSIYDLTSGAWSSFTFANSPLPNNTINRLTPVNDPNGPAYIWISTNGGAAKYTLPGSWSIINSTNGLSSNIVLDVAVDPTAFFGTTTLTWFATDIALTTWNGTTFTNQTGGGSCTSWSYATRVIVDRQHRVWFTPIQIIPARLQGKNQPAGPVYQPIGVCVWVWGFILPNSWTLYDTTSPGLPSDIVTDLSEDYAGRIWMSTAAGGVVNDNDTWRFYTTSTTPQLDDNLKAVLAAGEAVWWGHADLNAFSMYSPNWLRYTSSQIGVAPTALFMESTRTWAGGNMQIAYTTGGAWTTLSLPGSSSAVSSFARDGNNDLWVGTYGDGLYVFNPSNTLINHYGSTQGLPSDIITALYADDLGRIWAGTPAGLALHAQAGYWLTFTTSTSPLVSNFITALSQDNNKRLWIGTSNKGISIYDLNAAGNAAWKAQAQSTGVPSNTITGLVRDPVGKKMWVATGAGVGAWNQITSTWTVYSTTNGALPNNDATAITSDPSGRIWVTTRGGVALYAGGAWRSFHVPATSIENDRPFAVVADNDRTWIAATNSIAVRGVITSPIGNYVPNILGFTPIAAAPGATIVITGNAFDDRGPQFNIVTFPNQTGFPSIATDIQGATYSELTVTVPALASSGQLQVKANDLKSPLSLTHFQLRPEITGLSASCVAIGTELKINGAGFIDGGSGAYVKIGSGPERYADATDPTQVRTFIRAGDTSGPVRIRLTNGQTAFSAASVTVAGLALDQSETQQALQGQTMIWGKRTLVLLQLHSTGCAGATIDHAQLDWKMSTGPVGYGGNGNFVDYPGGKTFGLTAAASNVANDVSIMADLDLAFLAGDLNLPSSSSSLQFFQGVTVTLKNNFFPVLTIVLPANQFNYIDTAGARRHFIFMDVSGQDAAHQTANLDGILMNNLQTTARIFPQQDAGWYSLQYSWMSISPIWFSMPPVDFSPAHDNSGDAIDAVDDYLDPGGKTWAVAAIDPANLAPGIYNGVGGFGARTVADTNSPNSGGYGFLHELMHAFNFVESGAANYKNSSTPGEDHHSFYDEGQWGRNPGSTFSDCQPYATFRQALIDETGSDQRVVRLFGPEAPWQMLTAACGLSAGAAESRTAKSLISYAPGRSNNSAFLEPLDYQTIIDQICDPASLCPGYKGTPFTNPMGPQSPLDLVSSVTRTLHIDGKIDLSGNVTTSLSYVAVNDGALTPQQPLGQYHLIVRNAANTVLHDQVFDLQFDGTLPHPNNLNNLVIALYPQSPLTTTVDRFNLRVPFPIGAVEAEIRHDGTLLWSKTVSAHAPTVNFAAPNGGSYNAANTLPITWTANDLDSDPLQFGLDYSANNGATWTLIAPKLIGNSFKWLPNFVPPSTTARLRLRASDGFNVGMATSALFTLTARAPEAIILAPDDNSILTEGSILKLDGLALTGEGINQGTFTWKRGGVTIGTTRTITTALNSVGLITFTLNVSKDSLIGSGVVSVTVLPDYDQDGLPNSWELKYKLNPLDPADALADPDGDGLTNLQEYFYGTDPTKADTDGDGWSDGAEIAAGTDPLNPASHPVGNPILHVGAQSLGFTVNNQNPALDDKYTWVTNSGSGPLHWAAAKDANWLILSPSSGSAPTKLTVGAIANGLLTGTYTSYITVTAAGAIGSPRVITVTLQVDAVVPPKALFADCDEVSRFEAGRGDPVPFAPALRPRMREA